MQTCLEILIDARGRRRFFDLIGYNFTDRQTKKNADLADPIFEKVPKKFPIERPHFLEWSRSRGLMP